MHNRALFASFMTIALALGCSGASVTNGSGSGGVAGTGGTVSKATGPAGGVSTAVGETTALPMGGTQALGGTTSAAGSPAIGGTTTSGGSKTVGGSTSSTTGGATAAGGSNATTGGSKATGGTPTNGGTTTATGGSKAAGGATATGGSKTVGGTSTTGGSKATGGNSGTGGTRTPGGTTSAGGMTGTGGSSGSCTPPVVGSKGSNPLDTAVFTADPAPFVDNCTFYINCGHDEGTGNNFTMYEWFILKSTDMVHWTRTVGMRYTVFSWAHGNAWAGQMVTKGGKYYWYVPVEQGNGNGQMAIGVAVASSPEGPFTDAIGKPLVDDAFERSNMGFATDGDTPYTIDPTVFVDDDGQAYLHYGGFSRMVNAKLGADMISINGTMKESTPSCYFEAPFLTKRNSTYYEIYACGVNPPTIDYATSTSPLGPWTHKGTVLPKMVTLAGQDAATNHSGVAQFGDQWYIAYHVSNGPNGGGTYHREVAIDKLNFNSDGTIQQVTPSSGLTF
jgi:hypothetical protein